MKTKIVYVVVSNDSDIYLEQTLLSAYSARLYMPDVEIILIVDYLTNTTIKDKRSKILDYITTKIVVKIEGNYTNMQRSRILKTSIREHVRGDFLFIDSDTIITSSLSEIDSFNHDIGAVKNDHAPSIEECYNFRYMQGIQKDMKIMGYPMKKETKYFNSGVIYVKDNINTIQFFKNWNEYWYKGYSKGIYIDQVAFTIADTLNNSIIHELPGIWNCQSHYGLKYLKNSKIIHLINTQIPCPTEPFSKFKDKNLYIDIKKNGDIDNKNNQMMYMIMNSHEYFAESTYVIHDKDVYIWNSNSIVLFRYIYYTYSKLFKFIDFFSNYILKFMKNIHNLLK
jgi:hypothetical protein